MYSADIGRDDVDIGHQPHAGHADRVLDAGVVIDHIFLRHDMDDSLIFRDLDSPGSGYHLFDISLLDFAIVDRQNPRAVEPFDVVAGDPDEYINRAQITSRSLFSLAHRLFDGVDGALDIDHDAFFQALRRDNSDTDDLRGFIGYFAYHTADLGRTDIKTDHYITGLPLNINLRESLFFFFFVVIFHSFQPDPLCATSTLSFK